MSSIWLACCEGEHIARVREEIDAHTREAKVVRSSDLAGLAAMAGMLPGIAEGVAVYMPHDEEAIEPAISEVVRNDCAKTVLVMLNDLDAGRIACLFRAGATEVIAAGDPDLSLRKACAEEGVPHDEDGSGSPAVDSSASPSSEPSCSQPEEPQDRQPAVIQEERPIGEAGAPVPAPVVACGSCPAMLPANTPAQPSQPAADSVSHALVVPPTQNPSVVAAPVEIPASAPVAPAAPTPAAHTGELQIPLSHNANATGEAAAPSSSTGSFHITQEPARAAGEAPLIVAISGSGGCGKTTVVSAMAWWAAHMGLRAAIVDLDLMFGNAHMLMGVEHASDLAGLLAQNGGEPCAPQAIEATAMRIAPGLTVWGPCLAPEQAELMSQPSEQLIRVLRRESDVIFVDTSVFWGDAVASAVSHCDRCLVVGDGSVSSAPLTARAVALATRIGVPKTRMTSVFNRFGGNGAAEESAMRFEMAVALRSHARVADGGQAMADLLSFGKLGDLMASSTPFTRDIQELTFGMLRELGCPLEAWEERMRAQAAQGTKGRIKLPWKHEGADVR